MSGADINHQCISGVKPIDLAIYNSETWKVSYAEEELLYSLLS